MALIIIGRAHNIEFKVANIMRFKIFIKDYENIQDTKYIDMA